MKLPKLFGRKSAKSGDDFDDDFDDLDDDGGVDDSDSSVNDHNVDEDDMVGGEDYDEDEDFEVVAAQPHRRLLFLIAGGTGLAVILVVSGAAWWFFGGSGEHGGDEIPTAMSTSSHVVLAIPPRPVNQPATAKVKPGEKPSATDTLNTIAALSSGPGAGIVVKPIQPAAFTDTPAAPPSQPLPEAPDFDLVEQSPVGPLPKVSDDGRMPWQVYARPFQVAEGTPTVAIVFSELGMNPTTTEAAITYLPADVTLAFDPYGSRLADWITKARNAGHEVLLDLPLEPSDFPTRDPGPLALVTDSSTAENIQRLNFLLSRISGYTGVLSLMGSRFSQDDEQMRSILTILKERGLMYVDSRDGTGDAGLLIAKEVEMLRSFIDLVLDETPSQTAINRQLAQLERLAREKGVAVALARPYPISVSRIANWTASLGKQRIALAPVSALANRQPLP